MQSDPIRCDSELDPNKSSRDSGFFFLNRHPELKKHTEGIEQLNFPRTREGFRQCAAKDLPFRLTVVIKELHSQPSMQILRYTKTFSFAILKIIALHSVLTAPTAQDDGR